MISIVILGTGNVAKHLFDVIKTLNTFELIQVYGRNKNKLDYFNQEVSTTSELSTIKEAHLYIMAISDDAIAQVSNALHIKKGLVVHTAGSKSIKVINKNSRGVFYPLQSFSKEREVDFKEVPICIEAQNEPDLELLNQLASALSNRVVKIDSKQRRTLHLAAVFANNFTNHIYHRAEEICNQGGVSFDLLKPLIKETAEKVDDLSPFEAQTGPARRNDIKTILKQKKQLKTKNPKKIYSLLSKSIRKTYGKKL